MSAPVVRLIWDEAADQDLPLPSYETIGAAGADIRANLPPETRVAGLGWWWRIFGPICRPRPAWRGLL